MWFLGADVVRVQVKISFVFLALVLCQSVHHQVDRGSKESARNMIDDDWNEDSRATLQFSPLPCGLERGSIPASVMGARRK